MTIMQAIYDLVEKEEAVAKAHRHLAQVLDGVAKHTEGYPANTSEVLNTEAEPEKPDKASEDSGKNVTIDEVRAVLAELSQAGKTADVKILLSRRDAHKLSAVDPAQYPALLAEAKALL